MYVCMHVCMYNIYVYIIYMYIYQGACDPGGDACGLSLSLSLHLFLFSWCLCSWLCRRQCSLAQCSLVDSRILSLLALLVQKVHNLTQQSRAVLAGGWQNTQFTCFASTKITQLLRQFLYLDGRRRRTNM